MRATHGGAVTFAPRTRLTLVTSAPHHHAADLDHLADFEQWLRSWGAAESTVSVRIRVMRAACAAWPDLAEITTGDIERWLGSRHLAAWSRATYFQHAVSFFGWAHDTSRIDADPTARMRRPRAPKGLPRPLTRAQVTDVLATASGRPRAYVLLALYAGLRAHEIAKLRGEDVSPETIYIDGKGGQRAMVPTHPLLWDLARRHPSLGPWFPSRAASGHVTVEAVTAGVSRLFRSLGIEGSIHRCRHTYATDLLRGGANVRVVQTLMRHRSLASTEVYTAVTDDERARAIAGLGGDAA